MENLVDLGKTKLIGKLTQPDLDTQSFEEASLMTS
jgi:hypothetical protein